MKRVKVYYKTIKLLEALSLNTQKCPKYVLAYTVNPLKAQCITILTFLIKATASTDAKEKIPFLYQTLDFLNEVRFQTRVLSDLAFITKEGFGNIAYLLEECYMQCSAWLTSLGANKDELPKPTDLYDKEEREKINMLINASF